MPFGGATAVGVTASIFLTLQDASGNEISDPVLYASMSASGVVAAVADDSLVPLMFQYSPPDR